MIQLVKSVTQLKLNSITTVGNQKLIYFALAKLKNII